MPFNVFIQVISTQSSSNSVVLLEYNKKGQVQSLIDTLFNFFQSDNESQLAHFGKGHPNAITLVCNLVKVLIRKTNGNTFTKINVNCIHTIPMIINLEIPSKRERRHQLLQRLLCRVANGHFLFFFFLFYKEKSSEN